MFGLGQSYVKGLALASGRPVLSTLSVISIIDDDASVAHRDQESSELAWIPDPDVRVGR
jgi:hypothetical protein